MRSKKPSRKTTQSPPAMSRDNSAEGASTQRKNSDPEKPRKKRSHSTRKKSKKSDGTVASLKPTQALTVRESALVVEAAQLMSAKRADCVLVIDHEDGLSGIFTAKDLACRVVGEGLDAKTTTVRDIMTRDPKCVMKDTSAALALDTMVTRGFRHLPICSEVGDVVGLLDITKCLYEALQRMDRAFSSSKKLYDALEGVEKEWSSQPRQLSQYLDILREKMSCPDLASVLDGTPPVEVNTRTSVTSCARLMREHRTTAVLVMERDELAGIFTSKDIVNRVISVGLEPGSTPVARVMTPNPHTAPSNTSILDALRKMYDGHYLNLPVVDGEIIRGMVDVLKLTYAITEQIYSMENDQDAATTPGEPGGPMWSRFWNSMGNDDNESVISESITPSQSASNIPPPSPPSRMRRGGRMSPVDGDSSPYDYGSVIDDGSNASFPRGLDENTYTFKFKSPSGKTHRVTADYTSLVLVRQVVASKLPKTIKTFTLSYLDDDNDPVLMSTDEDVIDAVRCAQRQGVSKVVLLVVEKNDDDDTEEEHENLLLPGAITALAMTIVGVFAIAKLSR
ncbi:7283_t:CDS:2 [Paraglomus occultum]|uniref:7283_t:CDS:1 n=1 Tax=Paraglomus occultum TaxID=144539 RepID=A0A9N9F1I5_9GLOM|nr:7283_t:CDS:2 [Paraglomus occultum]